jgi:carboxyl-terminal processing protease
MTHRAGGSVRRLAVGVAAALVLCAGLAPARLSPQALATISTVGTPEDWAARVWDSARAGDETALRNALLAVPEDNDPAMVRIRASVKALQDNLAARETQRAEQIAQARTEMNKDLEGEVTDLKLSKALGHVMELWLLSTDKPGVIADPAVKALIDRSATAAKAAEARGDWMMASELFFRLDQLLEEPATFKKDSTRTNTRLSLLRLYVPQRLWELRNQRQLADGEESLPPYNPLGDDYKTKLAPVNSDMVLRSLLRAGTENVERVPLQKILIGGLEHLQTFVSTSDLQGAFPGLKEENGRQQMLKFLDQEIATLRAGPIKPDAGAVDSLVRRLTVGARVTLDLPENAVIHEFGNGSMSALDEYSVIIWPDEKARFDKMTQGKFVGIGVSIEYDELQNIKIVTPLEGTPAQRAGIRAGDVIKKIDGRAIFGATLDQAVDIITGPANTKVVVTVERVITKPDGSTDKVLVDFPLVRAIIETPSVRGWKRSGTREDAWDWFIDKESKIGYVRITGFNDGTSDELDRAVLQMKETGLKGLIFDLRFNPGGLLNQAVEVVNRFIDGGVVVKTKAPDEAFERVERASAGRATLRNLPVVVMVNETSASASEIVSGAVQTYARRKEIDAVLLGQRSFGKGSVQNVYSLGRDQAALKVTTQYYFLPDDRLIHRRAGAKVWGIDPDLTVDMLPKQQVDSIVLRRNADIIPLDENGKPIETTPEKTPNPQDLLSKPLDLQLQTALVLLEAQTLRAKNTAMGEGPTSKTP